MTVFLPLIDVPVFRFNLWNITLANPFVRWTWILPTFVLSLIIVSLRYSQWYISVSWSLSIVSLFFAVSLVAILIEIFAEWPRLEDYLKYADPLRSILVGHVSGSPRLLLGISVFFCEVGYSFFRTFYFSPLHSTDGWKEDRRRNREREEDNLRPTPVDNLRHVDYLSPISSIIIYLKNLGTSNIQTYRWTFGVCYFRPRGWRLATLSLSRREALGAAGRVWQKGWMGEALVAQVRITDCICNRWWNGHCSPNTSIRVCQIWYLR